MDKNIYLKRAENISNLSTLTDIANSHGSIREKKYKDLKRKIRDAQLDNVFAAMAAYCKR